MQSKYFFFNYANILQTFFVFLVKNLFITQICSFSVRVNHILVGFYQYPHLFSFFNDLTIFV